MTRGKDKPNMVPVLIRLPPELFEAVKNSARNEDRSVAATIRRALRLWVDEDATTTTTTQQPRNEE